MRQNLFTESFGVFPPIFESGVVVKRKSVSGRREEHLRYSVTEAAPRAGLWSHFKIRAKPLAELLLFHTTAGALYCILLSHLLFFDFRFAELSSIDSAIESRIYAVRLSHTLTSTVIGPKTQFSVGSYNGWLTHS